MTDYRLPPKKIEQFAKQLWATTGIISIEHCRLFVKSIIDSQIEHIRQQSGMTLISDAEIIGSIHVDAIHGEASKADFIRVAQAQLANDQLVIDKRVEALPKLIEALKIARDFTDEDSQKAIDKALSLVEGVGKHGKR